jgi:DNA-binding beta-propeller fold protein YncE
MRRSTTLAAWVLGTASFAFAQIGAPQLGWIPDGPRVRPVYGIPAAAAVGAPIPADQDYSQIAPSPARNYVVVSAADTGIVSIYTPEYGLVPLVGAGSAPDSVTLSPRGSSAVLWYASINQLQVITGLPDAPTIRQLNVSLLGPAPSELAVSDDGTWLATAGPRYVYAFGPNGEANRLPVESAAAIAFFPGTHDLALASSAGVQMLTGIGGFVVASTLLASADSSLQPMAVAATSDSKAVVLTDHSGLLTAIDIGSGTATTSDCACQPAGLFGMGPSAFRLTGLDAGAFKLFDAASGQILFVPLAITETEGTAQ